MSDFNSNREPVRIFVPGNCDGLEPLRDALAQHEDVELVGSSEHVADAFAPLAGGHPQVVLHGTRDAHLPVHDIASIREHTQAPLILLASGESSQLLSEALETDVADVLLLPQLADNVVFAVRKAAHAGRRLEAEGGHGRRGRVLTVFSPKGGTGKTVTATNLASAFAKYEKKRTLLIDLDLQFGDAAIMLGLEPEKTIYDLVVAPGELDSEKLAGYTTRHAAVLPRPDARDPRPHGRAARPVRARRAHAEERQARAAHARPAVLPRLARPVRPEQVELEGRDEAERGRKRTGREDRLRDAERPGGPPRGQPRDAGRRGGRRLRLLALHSRDRQGPAR